MSTVLDDEIGFDEPAQESTQEAGRDRNAVAISNDMARVQNALSEFDRVAAGIAAIEAQYPKDAIYEVGTTKGMKDAIEHRAAWRDPRITVEKARKMAKAPLLALGKSIDARAAWITEKLREGEEPIDQLIKAEESRREEERQARINAEAGRILAIQEALAEIGQNVLIACGKTSVEVRALSVKMHEALPDPEVFQEMIGQAKEAWAAGIAKLETTLKAKLWDEAEQARIAQERAAEEAQRRQEAERLEAQRAEQAAQAERLAAKQRALDEQAARIAAAQKAIDDAKAEEAARLEREQQEAQARADAKARAEREAEIAATLQAEAECQRVEAQRQREADAAARPIHPAAQALRNEQPTLKLGTICERLGFTVSAGFLSELGFEAAMDKRACLYRESEWADICAGISAHVLACAKVAEAA